MAGLVTATTSLVDETVTLFIPATPTATARPASPPFISLPDAAPLIVSKYTVGPAVLFLILFLVVSIGLSWRIHVTPKTENARRVMISAAVYGWVRVWTFIFRIWLIYAYSLGLYATYVFNVLLPSFLYTGVTFHLLLLSLLPTTLPNFAIPASKVVKICIIGYAPFLFLGITGIILGFTARTPETAAIGTNLRIATAADLLFLAVLLCVVSATAWWYLKKHEESNGMTSEETKAREGAYKLVVSCGMLFVLKFSYGVAALCYSPFATANSEAAWYCLSIVPEILSLLPFLSPRTVALLAVHKPIAITSVSSTDLVSPQPQQEEPRQRWWSRRIAPDSRGVKLVDAEVAGKGADGKESKQQGGSFEFLREESEGMA